MWICGTRSGLSWILLVTTHTSPSFGLEALHFLATGNVAGSHFSAASLFTEIVLRLESHLKVLVLGGTVYISWLGHMKIKRSAHLGPTWDTLEGYLPFFSSHNWLRSGFSASQPNFCQVILLPSLTCRCRTQQHSLTNLIHANIYLQVCSWEM